MENKPQIGIVAPEADITLLLSELGKKSPVLFSLADILPVPFETDSYPFVLGGADGVIVAARIDQTEDTEKIVEIVKTCKLVRQTDRFRTLLAIVLWGESAEEASLGIAHPNVLVCEPNTKHLPPTEKLTGILRAELPNIEPVDWVDRYDFIAAQFALKKAAQADSGLSEKINVLEEINQNLEEQIVQLKNDLEYRNNEQITALTDLTENKRRLEIEFAQLKKDSATQLAQLKEDLAKQNDENLNFLESSNQKLENQILQLKKEVGAEHDEKLGLLKTKEKLEEQIAELKANFAAQTDEKIKPLQERNSSLEKELVKAKKNSAIQTDEKVKSLQKANKILEKELARIKEDLLERNTEFEQIIELKNTEIESLRNNQEDKKKIKSLQKNNQNLENEIFRLRERLETLANEKNNSFEKVIQKLEKELVLCREELATQYDEKVHALESKQSLETQLAQLKKDLSARNIDKLNSLAEANEALENQLAQMKQELEMLSNQKISVLEEENQRLELGFARLNQELALKSEEFEKLIVLKNSEIEELQNNGRDENIIRALQIDNQNLETQIAQLKKELEGTNDENIVELLKTNQKLEQELTRLKKDFDDQSVELKRLVHLKDFVIDDLQKNQGTKNQTLENELTRLKQDFFTQADEFERVISLKDNVIEELRNSRDEENKKLAILVAKLNDEIDDLKAKRSPAVARLENELSAKTEEVRRLIALHSAQRTLLEESNDKIKELKEEIAYISTRENLLQKDLSDLIIHLREEFLNSRDQLTGKDTEIRRLRKQLERQDELAEVVLKSTNGENIAALRLEIDNEFSKDKPLYRIYSQLSLLRQECETLLKEKERLQGNLTETKKKSFSLREELEITKNNKILAKYHLKELEKKVQESPENEEENNADLSFVENQIEENELEEELLEIAG